MRSVYRQWTGVLLSLWICACGAQDQLGRESFGPELRAEVHSEAGRREAERLEFQERVEEQRDTIAETWSKAEQQAQEQAESAERLIVEIRVEEDRLHYEAEAITKSGPVGSQPTPEELAAHLARAEALEQAMAALDLKIVERESIQADYEEAMARSDSLAQEFDQFAPPNYTNTPIDKSMQDRVDTVHVFYGTNRERWRPEAKSFGRLFIGFGVVLLLALLLPGLLRRLLKTKYKHLITGLRWSLVTVSLLLLVRAVVFALRMEADRRNLPVQYGAEDSGLLETGICRVTIPRNKQDGAIPVPSLIKLEVYNDPTKHMILENVHPLVEPEFLEALRDRVGASSERELFVFVHGYRNTFKFAALRTAQIAYDLGFKGTPAFFSWPATGETISYSYDHQNARTAAKYLARYLQLIRLESQAETIHLVAHSMGSLVVMEALGQLRRDEGLELPAFDELILAAADIDVTEFVDNSKEILELARRTTLYASEHDSALEASQTFWGKQRLGDSKPGVTVIAGADSIDVSDVSEGHSYISKSGRILEDLIALLRYGRPAGGARGLVWDQAGHWVIRARAKVEETDR